MGAGWYIANLLDLLARLGQGHQVHHRCLEVLLLLEDLAFLVFHQVPGCRALP